MLYSDHICVILTSLKLHWPGFPSLSHLVAETVEQVQKLVKNLFCDWFSNSYSGRNIWCDILEVIKHFEVLKSSRTVKISLFMSYMVIMREIVLLIQLYTIWNQLTDPWPSNKGLRLGVRYGRDTDNYHN